MANSKGIVECSKCGETAFYEGDNPNDVTEQTGFNMIQSDVWLCPTCSKDEFDVEGC